MRILVKETESITRIRVPFEDLYTSVFIVKVDGGILLVDCATTSFDVDEYIVPSIKKLGYNLSDVRGIVITHHHSDHDGGLTRIRELIPNIEVINEVRAISDDIVTYPLPGHTRHCIGLFDGRCEALISGDGLQGAGVGKYRCSLEDKTMYLDTLRRIESDEKIKKILFSHAYEPWYRDSVTERSEVLFAVGECAKYIGEKL
jgi:glyoxylase-like metal-dependent hydrolase (beta-lactamase superfamily II)